MSNSAFTGIVRVTPAFLCGMFAAMYFHPDPLFLSFLLVFSFLMLIGLRFFLNSGNKYNYRWLNGLCIHFSIATAVCLVTHSKNEIFYPTHFSNQSSSIALKGIVNEAPVVKGKNLRFELKVVAVKSDSSWFETKGRCLVYIRRDSIKEIPEYGDVLLFLKTPVEVMPPLNPGQFNFQAWLQNRQIYHQVFLKGEDLQIIDEKQGNYFMDKAIIWREYLLAVFKRAGISGQEEAVLSALILGQDDEIDAELIKSYSVAGVLHVLAVSGMHVGLIYGAIRAMIGFPGKRRSQRWIKALFLIACLWLYAMLTGLSPSVLRAAMMISFVVAGLALDRTVNPLNILSASALCLFLIFSPALILSAGFQLSYLAVAGIMFLYKPVSSIFTPSTWLGAQIWSILSVSIVAQLATFPLSIYLFHSFPNYFLLSNLLIIPLSTFIIFGGIILLFLSWWTELIVFLGKILTWMIELLNQCVVYLGEMPGSTTNGLFISGLGLFLLYLTVWYLSSFFLTVRPRLLIYCFSILIMLYSIKLVRTFKIQNEKSIVVYHSAKHSYIQFINGANVYSLADSTIFANPDFRRKISENYLLEKGVKSEKVFELDSCEYKENIFMYKFPFVEFGNVKFFILNEDSKKIIPVSPDIDYVLLAGNPKVKVVEWIEGMKCKTILADASNAAWVLYKWKAECLRNGINFVDISKTGAWKYYFSHEFTNKNR